MKILINLLKEAQDKKGYLSEKVMKGLSEKYDIPLSRLYGVATFYMHLKITPQGKNIIEVCGSPSCILNNGNTVEKSFEEELKIEAGETTKDKQFTLYKVSCIGCCDEAPAALINGKAYTKLTSEKVKKIIKELRSKESSKTKPRKKK